jgi:ABC-type glycerol-3-phosphate transport system substrate-binding protein
MQSALTSSAIISRHWYNTLNQMMADLGSEKRASYSITMLPGFGAGQSYMTTAGEWYLAVPAYSAAPEVAMDVIEYLTTPDNEMQRLHLGVSLPTRADYYSPDAPRMATDFSPFFEMPRDALSNLVEGVFRRSDFPKYQAFAETLSSHLQRLLFVGSPHYGHVLDGLTAALNFVNSRMARETK